MRLSRWLPVVVMAGVASAAADLDAEKWTKGRMSLFIVSRTLTASSDADRTTRAKEAKDAFDVAQRQFKSVEQDLKKRNGGKRDQWPADARETFDRADQVRRDARDRWLDTQQTQADLDRWTDAFRKVILGKQVEHTAAASGREDADLIVEAIRAPITDQDPLCLRVGPGGRLDPSKLAGAPIVWRSANVTEVHTLSAAEPFWEIEAISGGMMGAHQAASSGLGGVIREYFDRFAAARLQP